jgi:hypothetical protein
MHIESESKGVTDAWNYETAFRSAGRGIPVFAGHNLHFLEFRQGSSQTSIRMSLICGHALACLCLCYMSDVYALIRL